MHHVEAEVLHHEAKTDSRTGKDILLPVGLYLLWTIATYLLENRMDLYQQPTVAGRYLYVIVANVVIGIFGVFWAIRSMLGSGLLTVTQAGIRPVSRTLVATLIALIVGVAYFAFLRPPSVPLLVVINGYLQVLPVSIAEILVCWALLGATVESFMRGKGKVLSATVGMVAASVFFSVYHIGHSAPFNQLNMMLFLLIPAVFTSLFWLVSREIYATILFHNFQGIIGVIGNLKEPELLNRPLYPLYLLALIAVFGLLAARKFMVREE